LLSKKRCQLISLILARRAPSLLQLVESEKLYPVI
jgi:hypothetical protein